MFQAQFLNWSADVVIHFAETVKFDAEQMLKQCRQRIEKVHHFLTEYERKAKEVTMQRAREKLGAFFSHG